MEETQMATRDVHVPTLAARELACAVIKQAMMDALDPTASPTLRHDAEEFLTGDPWYEAWCRTAGITSTPLMTKHTS
jgi:hypothetical protein